MTQYRSMGIAAAEYGDSVNEIDAEAHFFSPSSVNYPTACATTFQKVVGIVLLCATCVFVGGAVVSPVSSPTPSSASVASLTSVMSCSIPSSVSVANGGMGTCTGTLANGASCNIACYAGYTPSWTTMTCYSGSLSSAPTCDKQCSIPSNISVANGVRGTCTGTLASGASCSIACNAGYTPSNWNGAISCYSGSLSSAPTCISPTCTIPSNISVANGGMGNCTGTLANGASCNIACHAGYTPSWTTMTCHSGSLFPIPTSVSCQY